MSHAVVEFLTHDGRVMWLRPACQGGSELHRTVAETLESRSMSFGFR